MDEFKIGIVGLGPVGLCTMADMAWRLPDATIYGNDCDESVMASLERQELHIYEPGLHTALFSKDNVEFTTELPKCHAYILCIGTPARDENSQSALNTDALEAAIHQYSHQDAAVIIRSTITAELCDKYESNDNLYHVPEFMREGCALKDLEIVEYLVAGKFSDRRSVRDKIIRTLFRHPAATLDVVISTARNTMMLKLASNAWHAYKIVFANEIARACDNTGASARDVMRMLASYKDMNLSARYMRPGFSYGGSCLAKDVDQLSHDIPSGVIAGLNASNQDHIRWAAARIGKYLTENRVEQLTVLGCAFKADTNDMRRNPIVTLCEFIKLSAPVQITVMDLYTTTDKLRETFPECENHVSITPQHKWDSWVSDETNTAPKRAILVTQWDDTYRRLLNDAASWSVYDIHIDLYNSPRGLLDAYAMRSQGSAHYVIT